MSRRNFESMRTECENNVKDILRKSGSIDLEMTKSIVVEDDEVIDPQTIFMSNEDVWVTDTDNRNHVIKGCAIFDVYELLDEYLNDQCEITAIIFR